jgi:hypothetical protein
MTVGTSTTTGVGLTVTLSNLRFNQPNCVGEVYLAASPYTQIPARATSTTTTVVFNLGSAPMASTAYEFEYHCFGN